jgi:glycosyltransferase involved in cell wall biosynthesis
VKVLHVAPAFFPATYWGGPIYSMASLCKALAQRGVTVEVLTTDSAGPRLRDRVVVNRGESLERGVTVLYGSAKSADVVHLTGVYSFPTIPTLVACRLLQKPLVWSARGALKRWSGTSATRRKAAWNYVCRTLAHSKLLSLHVTSQEELVESKSALPGVSCALIPNGIDVPETLRGRTWKPNGVVRLLFLGRLDPIKGIENLLAAVRDPSLSNVELVIRGTGESGYASSLVKLASQYRLQQKVRFGGFADDEAKAEAFAAADICVVPSHSENFGMVVAESLANGVPVIASKGTPWPALERRGCGLWVSNDPQSLASAIRRLSTMDLEQMGKRGREWMKSEFRWDAIAAQTIDVYTQLASTRHAAATG